MKLNMNIFKVYKNSAIELRNISFYLYFVLIIPHSKLSLTKKFSTSTKSDDTFD